MHVLETLITDLIAAHLKIKEIGLDNKHAILLLLIHKITYRYNFTL